MAEARATYRALLRAIDRNITRVSGNSLWAQYAKEESCRPVTDKGDLACRLQKARDYIFLLESIRRHKELLLSYNVGVRVEDREKRMNERAAELVGLRMPRKADDA